MSLRERRAHSRAEIRAGMNRRLGGHEAGLAALWNFDAGDARDLGPGGHHGRLHGDARTDAAPVASRISSTKSRWVRQAAVSSSLPR